MQRRVLLAQAGALALVGCATGKADPIAKASKGKPLPAPPAEVRSETQRLNAWFEAIWEDELARTPEALTFQGRKERYGEWDDPSPAAEDARFVRAEERAAYLKANFDPEKLDPAGRLSYQLFLFEAERRRAGRPFRAHGYVFNQMFGVQSAIPAFLINQHRIDSAADAQAYVSRLAGVQAYLAAHQRNATERFAAGVFPPAHIYDYVRADIANLLKGAPFTDGADGTLLADFRAKIAKLDLTDQARANLLAQAVSALKAHVGPAYQALDAEMARQQGAAASRTGQGVWSLPQGRDFYAQRLAFMTTTDMTAAQIHQLGLEQVARTHDQMRAIMHQVSFPGDLKAFFAFVTQFTYPNTPEGKQAYLAEATRLIDDMRARLDSQFGRKPKADMVVKAVEAFREKSAGRAFYQRPATDGSRPGIYYANLSDMADMPRYQMAALAYHEGIPGHHLQIAIQQELPDLPAFRRFGGYTAYSEGWGLYAELVPKEMGLYEDPYADFGRLVLQLRRAIRLVVDTGLHDLQWTRDQAVEYILANQPSTLAEARKDIDRYLVMPGQATAYMIGMLAILKMREEARARLGAAFDIRAFHDLLLENGPLPLDLLAQMVWAWKPA